MYLQFCNKPVVSRKELIILVRLLAMSFPSTSINGDVIFFFCHTINISYHVQWKNLRFMDQEPANLRLLDFWCQRHGDEHIFLASFFCVISCAEGAQGMSASHYEND